MSSTLSTKRFVKLSSIGRALPEEVLSTDEIMSQIKLPLSSKFKLLTGIQSRRVCSPFENSYTLALDAAKNCLHHKNTPNRDIDMIISCSISRYLDANRQVYEPSLSFLLKNELGFPNARNMDISNACAGMFTALYTGKILIEQGAIRNCLIVSGEFISHLIHNAVKHIKTPASLEFASLTVGDAGSAILLEESSNQEEAIRTYGFSSITKYNKLCTAQPKNSCQGAVMKTHAKQIHDLSISNSIPILENALASFDLSYSDIDYLIPHQTSRSAILSGSRIYSEHFGGRPKNILMNFMENGNTASTSHFICLYDHLLKGIFNPDDNILAISYASGLTFGILNFKINDLAKLYGNHHS